MAKKVTAWLSSLLIIVTYASSQAFASDEFYENYMSFQIYGANYEETDSGTTSESDHTFLGGTYGKMINDTVSVEGRIGLTDKSGYNNGLVSYGGYMRAIHKIQDYGFYGLLGYSSTYSYVKDVGNASESGLSYGAGIELFGSDDLALTIEYINFYDGTSEGIDYSLTAFSLGFTYYFGGKESPFGNRDIRGSGSLRTYE